MFNKIKTNFSVKIDIKFSDSFIGKITIKNEKKDKGGTHSSNSVTQFLPTFL